MICKNCGSQFDLADARERFDHYYSQSSHWTYDEVISEPLCFDCATDEADDEWFNGELEDEYEP